MKVVCYFYLMDIFPLFYKFIVLFLFGKALETLFLEYFSILYGQLIRV